VVINGGQEHLIGVAETQDEAVNFKVKFDYAELDQKEMFSDLREQIAAAFDITVYHVDLREKELEDKLYKSAEAMVSQFVHRIVS